MVHPRRFIAVKMVGFNICLFRVFNYEKSIINFRKKWKTNENE